MLHHHLFPHPEMAAETVAENVWFLVRGEAIFSIKNGWNSNLSTFSMELLAWSSRFDLVMSRVTLCPDSPKEDPRRLATERSSLKVESDSDGLEWLCSPSYVAVSIDWSSILLCTWEQELSARNTPDIPSFDLHVRYLKFLERLKNQGNWRACRTVFTFFLTGHDGAKEHLK